MLMLSVNNFFIKTSFTVTILLLIELLHAYDRSCSVVTRVRLSLLVICADIFPACFLVKYSDVGKNFKRLFVSVLLSKVLVVVMW